MGITMLVLGFAWVRTQGIVLSTLGPLLQRLEFPALFFSLLLELCSIYFANILWYDYWVLVNIEESFSIFLLCTILFVSYSFILL